MNSEDRIALIRRYYEAWEKGDLDGLHDCLADHCINYHPATEEARDGIDFELSTCELWHESFSDVKVEMKQVHVDGEYVTLYYVLHSTHTSELMRLPPTGKLVHVGGMEIDRIVDGKIVEVWRLFDMSSLMQQLRGSSSF